MSDNPSQQQIAYAYGQFIKRHNGDADAAMADIQTFMLGYSAPPTDTTRADMVLEEPAMVGNSIFSAGYPWFAVVQRAIKEYAEHGGPQPSATRIAEFRQWIEQGQPAQQLAEKP